MSAPAPSGPVDWPGAFPPTRYQGSKRKLMPILAEITADLPGEHALDAFCGTAAVGYLLRSQGRRVHCNDLLASAALCAEALLAAPGEELDEARACALLEPVPGRAYDDFIQREYRGLAFTDEEHRQLDCAAQNLPSLPHALRSQAWYALAQACLIKRPYNLFHRANLNLRLAEVQRSFGNKASWDRPFAQLLPRFLGQVRRARLPGLPPARVSTQDVLELEPGFDLVYLDPPYTPARGAAPDYGDLYHFLEGMLDYGGWPQRIDRSRRHRPCRCSPGGFGRPEEAERRLVRVLEHFASATLVLSYRSDGRPSPEVLLATLRRLKAKVRVVDAGDYRYALSPRRGTRELIFIGT